MVTRESGLARFPPKLGLLIAATRGTEIPVVEEIGPAGDAARQSVSELQELAETWTEVPIASTIQATQ